MVFKRPKLDVENPIPSFVNHYLSAALTTTDDNAEYVIEVAGNTLPMQKDKLILQFFDKEHSRAGLRCLSRNLMKEVVHSSSYLVTILTKNSTDLHMTSSMMVLPISYAVLSGLLRMRIELAKYLSSHITAHRLCKLNNKDTVLPQLKQFFKGQNVRSSFSAYGKKLYQYSVITRKLQLCSVLLSVYWSWNKQNDWHKVPNSKNFLAGLLRN